MFTNNHVIINKEDMTMSERLIYSKSWIRHKINVTVFVPVPGCMEKTEAPAMGNSPMERDENIMKFAEEILFPQYFNAAKSIIRAYEESPMPLKWINAQSIIIRQLDHYDFAFFSKETGSIILDNDSACGMKYGVPGELSFGAMVGQKILSIKHSTDLIKKVEEQIPMINWTYLMNDYFAEQFLAELTGEIVSKESSRELFWLDERERKYFQNEILKIAWS